MRSALESFLLWNREKNLGLRNKARKWFPKLKSISVDYMIEMIVALCLILIISMILLKKMPRRFVKHSPDGGCIQRGFIHRGKP